MKELTFFAIYGALLCGLIVSVTRTISRMAHHVEAPGTKLHDR